MRRRRSITRPDTARARGNGVFARKDLHMKRTRFRQLPAEPKQELLPGETAEAVTPPLPSTSSVHVDVDLGSDAAELTESEWSAFVGLD